MSSDEDEEVTAMKRVRSNAIAPGFPSSATAAKGADNPEDISDGVILLGYVGYAGLSVRATAASLPQIVSLSNNPKLPRGGSHSDDLSRSQVVAPL